MSQRFYSGNRDLVGTYNAVVEDYKARLALQESQPGDYPYNSDVRLKGLSPEGFILYEVIPHNGTRWTNAVPQWEAGAMPLDQFVKWLAGLTIKVVNPSQFPVGVWERGSRKNFYLKKGAIW